MQSNLATTEAGNPGYPSDDQSAAFKSAALRMNNACDATDKAETKVALAGWATVDDAHAERLTNEEAVTVLLIQAERNGIKGKSLDSYRARARHVVMAGQVEEEARKGVNPLTWAKNAMAKANAADKKARDKEEAEEAEKAATVALNKALAPFMADAMTALDLDPSDVGAFVTHQAEVTAKAADLLARSTAREAFADAVKTARSMGVSDEDMLAAIAA